DDYVAKPFDLRELVARVRSVLRRIRAAAALVAGHEADADPAIDPCLVFDGWPLDFAALSLALPDGSQVTLATGEFDLLAAFARNPNRALSRDMLMDLIHHREASPYDRSIDVQVGRLRRKIENDPARPEMIKSVRGVGYIFAPRVSSE